MSPVNVPAIGAYIREQREQARISLRQLAQATGVSNPYLSQIERGLRKPSADILQQLAKGLRISAEALYVQAGFLEDRPEGQRQGVREAVLTDRELTERQKQMLLEIYDSFRNEAALDAAEGEDTETAQPGDAGLDPVALAWPEMSEGLADAGSDQAQAGAAEALQEEVVLQHGVLEEEEAALEEAVLEEVALEEAALEEAILERAIQERAAQQQREAQKADADGAGKEQAGPHAAAQKAGPKRAGPPRTARSRASKQPGPDKGAAQHAGPDKAAAQRPGPDAAAPDGAARDGAEPARPAKPKSGVRATNGSRAGRARPSTPRKG